MTREWSIYQRMRGLKGAFSKEDREAGKHDVGNRKAGDGHDDDIGDLGVDVIEELDKAREEEEDCHVHQERDILDYPTCMDDQVAFKEVRANPDSMLGRLLPSRDLYLQVHCCTSVAARHTKD